ncbi:hypothetical protein V2J09_013059 [Rumex salicifolius]
MKDLGELKNFLGLEVERSSRGLFVCQRRYAEDLLKKYGMQNCKPIDSPMEVRHMLCAEEGDELEDARLYRQLVGSLIYLTITLPNLTYAVGVVCQFMQTPRKPHLEAVRRIVRYVRHTVEYGIFYEADRQTYRHLPLKPVTQPSLGDITNHSDVNDDEFPCPSTIDKYVDVGDPLCICQKCGANMWFMERIKMDPRSENFSKNIRAYNMMFSFTSLGGRITEMDEDNLHLQLLEDDSEVDSTIHKRRSTSSYVPIGAQTIQLEKMAVDISALREEIS